MARFRRDKPACFWVMMAMRIIADQMMAKMDGTALPARATAIATAAIGTIGTTTKTTGTKKTGG
jgi:hypothetical protein